MVNEVSNTASFLSQLQWPNNQENRGEVPLIGDKSGQLSGFNTQDIVEISGKRPDKNQDGDKISVGLEDEFTDEEKRAVEELKKRDREVRQHEQAHLSTAGPYAHGASYKYQVGPDGKRYAVGGEVSIDTSEVPDNPDATIAKAQTIHRAANAPAKPSGQDRQVAAEATRMEASARAEKMEEAREDGGGKEATANVGEEGGSEVDNFDKAEKNDSQKSNPAYTQNGAIPGKILDLVV